MFSLTPYCLGKSLLPRLTAVCRVLPHLTASYNVLQRLSVYLRALAEIQENQIVQWLVHSLSHSLIIVLSVVHYTLYTAIFTELIIQNLNFFIIASRVLEATLY